MQWIHTGVFTVLLVATAGLFDWTRPCESDDVAQLQRTHHNNTSINRARAYMDMSAGSMHNCFSQDSRVYCSKLLNSTFLSSSFTQRESLELHKTVKRTSLNAMSGHNEWKIAMHQNFGKQNGFGWPKSLAKTWPLISASPMGILWLQQVGAGFTILISLLCYFWDETVSAFKLCQFYDKIQTINSLILVLFIVAWQMKLPQFKWSGNTSFLQVIAPN